VHDGWTRGSKHYLGIYASYSIAKSNNTKLRLLSVTKMVEGDVVIVEDDNFDLNQDDSSDDEVGASSKVIIRESSNFKAEVINNTIRLVLSEYDIEMAKAIEDKKSRPRLSRHNANLRNMNMNMDSRSRSFF